MSVLSYNGIVLPYAHTTVFNQTALRDKEGDTDFYATKYEIQVTTILNSAFLYTIPEKFLDYLSKSTDNEGQSTATPASMMRSIRHYLLLPRKSLSFVFNGVEMIPQPIDGNKGTVDCQNGPKPEFCKIVQLSDDSFIMTYSITAIYWDKLKQDDNGTKMEKGNPVLYNRWSESVDIDECEFTIRTRSGVFCIRSDNQDGGQADEWRDRMAVVGVPPGFVRQSSNYTISPDGLSLQYKIVDREVFKPPVYPSYKSSGRYTETTTHNSAQRHGECTVRLEGAKWVRQSDLVKNALIIAISKLGIAGNANLKKVSPKDAGNDVGSASFGYVGAKFFTFLEFGSITIDLFNNIVDVTLRCRLAPNKGRIFGLAGLNDYTENKEAKKLTDLDNQSRGRLCYTVGTSAGYSGERKYYTRGYANILLEAAKYYDPDNVNLEIGERADRSQITINQPIPTDNQTQLNKGTRVGQAGKKGE